MRPTTGREGRISGVTTPRPGWKVLSAALAVAGATHLARPAPYDRLVPRVLGAPRPWVHGSGLAELAVAGALLHPRTRSLGGWAAAALFVAVFPGNVTMATRAAGSPRASTTARTLTLARLPLQLPLVWWAVAVARHAAGGAGRTR